ncbi:MAG: hypothetical protein KC560_14885 [Myxococcales bacterium]|nr:hypothetical protein [Myxococcales bacterium]
MLVLLMGASASAHSFGFDFGLFRDAFLARNARTLFGLFGTVGASSQMSLDAATIEADPRKVATFAKRLRVDVVSAEANLGANVDMMALWPNDVHPTHLIVCNEQGTTEPGVQRIALATGAVETILTGTNSCDPAHRTPWGTILVAEESGSTGSALEIIDPLHTTGVQYDRSTGVLSGADAGNVALRRALGHLSYEGVGILPNGIVYYGDENRPSQGTPGGAYFKFVPTAPWAGGAPITDLDDSPLVDGQVYGLRLGLRSGATDYGQGTQTGLGTWVAIPGSFDADLRAAAATLELTGYYRPEDLALDLEALASGDVRFCANNTGNESNDLYYGEAICVTDGTLDQALANTATPEVQLFVVGTPQLAMMDNMAYQPGRGLWILMEDGDQLQGNNDMWACLDDGADEDLLSDGCVRIATLNDLNAEWTGGLFDASGKRFYVSVQHNATGHGIVLEVTGWR